MKQFIEKFNNPPQNRVSKLCIRCAKIYYDIKALPYHENLCYKCRKIPREINGICLASALEQNNLSFNDTSTYKSQSSWEDYYQCCVVEIEKTVINK